MGQTHTQAAHRPAAGATSCVSQTVVTLGINGYRLLGPMPRSSSSNSMSGNCKAARVQTRACHSMDLDSRKCL